MPKNKNSRQKGFVDPLSLIAIGFLITTLIIGVSVTNNTAKTFLYNSYAKVCPDCNVRIAERRAANEGGDAWEDSSTGKTCVGAACVAIVQNTDNNPDNNVVLPDGTTPVSTEYQKAIDEQKKLDQEAQQANEMAKESALVDSVGLLIKYIGLDSTENFKAASDICIANGASDCFSKEGVKKFASSVLNDPEYEARVREQVVTNLSKPILYPVTKDKPESEEPVVDMPKAEVPEAEVPEATTDEIKQPTQNNLQYTNQEATTKQKEAQKKAIEELKQDLPEEVQENLYGGVEDLIGKTPSNELVYDLGYYEQYAPGTTGSLPPALQELASNATDPDVIKYYENLSQNSAGAASINTLLLDNDSNNYTGCLTKFGKDKCSRALTEAAQTKDDGVVYYKLSDPERDIQDIQQQLIEERSDALKIAAFTYAFAPIAASSTTLGSLAGQSFLKFGQITAGVQTLKAADAQIKDPFSKEANIETAWAALAVVNGVSAQYLNNSFLSGVPSAIEKARKINTAVSVTNLVVDVPYAISECRNKDDSPGVLSSCNLAIAAVVADVGFGLLDFKQGQLSFGSPFAQTDIPNTTGSRIATLKEIEDLEGLDSLRKTELGQAGAPSIKPVDAEVDMLFAPRDVDLPDAPAIKPVEIETPRVEVSPDAIELKLVKETGSDPMGNITYSTADDNIIVRMNSTGEYTVVSKHGDSPTVLIGDEFSLNNIKYFLSDIPSSTSTKPTSLATKFKNFVDKYILDRGGELFPVLEVDPRAIDERSSAQVLSEMLPNIYNKPGNKEKVFFELKRVIDKSDDILTNVDIGSREGVDIVNRQFLQDLASTDATATNPESIDFFKRIITVNLYGGNTKYANQALEKLSDSGIETIGAITARQLELNKKSLLEKTSDSLNNLFTKEVGTTDNFGIDFTIKDSLEAVGDSIIKGNAPTEGVKVSVPERIGTWWSNNVVDENGLFLPKVNGPSVLEPEGVVIPRENLNAPDIPLTKLEEANVKVANIMNERFDKTGSTLQVEIKKRPYSYEIQTFENTDPNNPIRTFWAGTTDTVLFKNILLDQIGPASLSQDLLPIIKDINIKSINDAAGIDFRGQGYGTQIVSTFESAAKELGLDTIAATNISNKDAYDFWIKQGFVPPHNYQGDGTIPPYAMVKNIQPDPTTLWQDLTNQEPQLSQFRSNPDTPSSPTQTSELAKWWDGMINGSAPTGGVKVSVPERIGNLVQTATDNVQTRLKNIFDPPATKVTTVSKLDLDTSVPAVYKEQPLGIHEPPSLDDLKTTYKTADNILLTKAEDGRMFITTKNDQRVEIFTGEPIDIDGKPFIITYDPAGGTSPKLYEISSVVTQKDLTENIVTSANQAEILRAQVSDARLNDTPLVVYKGIQDFDASQGVLPGAFTQKSNTVGQTTYQVGTGIGESSVETALNHALLGSTSESAFSSWTPKYTTARMYAGEGGTVLQKTINLSDSKIIDIAPLIGKDFLPIDSQLRIDIEFATDTRIAEIARSQRISYGQARKQVTEAVTRNGKSIVNNTNEILIPGIIKDYQIATPPNLTPTNAVLDTASPTQTSGLAKWWDGIKNGSAPTGGVKVSVPERVGTWWNSNVIDENGLLFPKVNGPDILKPGEPVIVKTDINIDNVPAVKQTEVDAPPSTSTKQTDNYGIDFEVGDSVEAVADSTKTELVGWFENNVYSDGILFPKVNGPSVFEPGEVALTRENLEVPDVPTQQVANIPSSPTQQTSLAGLWDNIINGSAPTGGVKVSVPERVGNLFDRVVNNRNMTPEERTLGSLLQAYDRYGIRIQTDINLSKQGRAGIEESFADLSEIARENGYKVVLVNADQKVPLITNGKEISEALDIKNAARIGADGKTLYVLEHPNVAGLPADMPDMTHDIGAIVTGGKEIPKGQVGGFSPEFLTSQSGGTITPYQITHELIDTGTGQVPTTWFFDAMVENVVRRQTFEGINIPTPTVNRPKLNTTNFGVGFGTGLVITVGAGYTMDQLFFDGKYTNIVIDTFNNFLDNVLNKNIKKSEEINSLQKSPTLPESNEGVSLQDDIKTDLIDTNSKSVVDNTPISFGNTYRPIDDTNKLVKQVVPTEIIIHWDGQPGAPQGWNTNTTFNGLSGAILDPETGLWRSTDSHFGIDKDGIVQFLGLNGETVQFSYGSKGYPTAINIEMAGSDFTIYNDGTTNVPQGEIDNTVNLIVRLMQQYDIPINNIFGHSERDDSKDISFILDDNGKPVDIIVNEKDTVTDRSKPDPGVNFMNYIRSQVEEQLSTPPETSIKVNSSQTSTNISLNQPASVTNTVQSIADFAESKMETCVPGFNGYVNACPGEFYAGQKLESTENIDSTVNNTGRSPTDLYWCTDLIFDSAESVGVEFKYEIPGAKRLYDDMAEKDAVVLAENANYTPGNENIREGMTVFVSKPSQTGSDVYTVAHVGVLSEINVTDSSAYVTLIQSNAGAKEVTYTQDGQGRFVWVNDSGVPYYIRGFGNIETYAQNQ